MKTLLTLDGTGPVIRITTLWDRYALPSGSRSGRGEESTLSSGLAAAQ